MNEKLLPCPFCEAEVTLTQDPTTKYFGPEGKHKGTCPIDLDYHDYADPQQAIREWNSRANSMAAQSDRVKALEEALHEGRRAIGDHFAPNDCYATGPLSGDPIRDLVQCPACSFIAMYDAALAPVHTPDTAQGGGEAR